MLPSFTRRRAGGEIKMKPRNIIIGQKVSPEKKVQSQEFRKQMTPEKKYCENI